MSSVNDFPKYTDTLQHLQVEKRVSKSRPGVGEFHSLTSQLSVGRHRLISDPGAQQWTRKKKLGAFIFKSMLFTQSLSDSL